MDATQQRAMTAIKERLAAGPGLKTSDLDEPCPKEGPCRESAQSILTHEIVALRQQADNCEALLRLLDSAGGAEAELVIYELLTNYRGLRSL